MIPYLPTGATIDSILIAIARLSGTSAMRTRMASFYGRKVTYFKQNILGFHAALLAQGPLDGKLPAEELLTSHSAAAVAVAYLTPTEATEFMHGCVAGVPRRPLTYWQPPVWKACRECVAADMRLGGLAYWRVLHQLPGVQRCPTHGMPLVHRCARCSGPLGGPGLLTLPGDPCPTCGWRRIKNEAVVQIAGRDAFLSLYERLFARTVGLQTFEGFDFSEVSGAQLSEKIIDCDEFLKFFGCPHLEGFAKYLGMPHAQMRSLRLILSGENVRPRGAIRHAVAAFRESNQAGI